MQVLKLKIKSMNKFRFCTGVKILDNPHIEGGIDSGNGVVVIPFEADAPENAKLAFCSDYPHHSHKNGKELLRCEIKNSKIISKYAYFYI
jgi:hypothetical protein